jgi:hypothetical protein
MNEYIDDATFDSAAYFSQLEYEWKQRYLQDTHINEWQQQYQQEPRNEPNINEWYGLMHLMNGLNPCAEIPLGVEVPTYVFHEQIEPKPRVNWIREGF